MIIFSTKRRYEGILRLLLFYGANPNSKDYLGINALTYAVAMNYFEEVKILLPYSSSSDLNSIRANNFTALDYAIKNGNSEMVNLLISKGANFSNTCLRSYNNAYIFISLSRNNKVIEIILKYLNFLKNKLFESIIKSNKTLFKKTWMNLGTIFITDDQKNNVLHYAVKSSNEDFIILFLMICPKLINNKNNLSLTPLQISLSNLDIFKLFMKVAYG